MSHELRTESREADPVYGRCGEVRYECLEDTLFNVPGRWRIRANAKLCWLDPAPIRRDMPLAYAEYHTHVDDQDGVDAMPARASWYYKLRERVWQARKAAAVAGRKARLPWPAYLPPVSEQLRFDSGFIPPINGGTLLDVGCGSGQMIERLNALGWDASGIDPDTNAVQHAQAMGRPVTLAGVESLSERPGSLDAATLYHVIEHVYDPVQVLSDVHRLLKPGGRVVIVTPNMFSLASRIYGRHWRGLEPPRHLQLFTRDSLRDALHKAGFASADVKTSYRDASGMVCASDANRKRASGRWSGGTARTTRIFADTVLLAEWLLTRLGAAAGEELVAVARKG